MGFADHYLAKQKDLDSLISESIHPGTEIIIIIPAFNEPELTTSLGSIYECIPPACKVEVIILTNWPENCPVEIKKSSLSTLANINTWIESHQAQHIRFHSCIYPDMPDRHAGVGLARKTLMDEAVRRFNSISCPKGIIVSFDADAVCDRNYLQEIEKHFIQFPKTDGCVIYFEHPLSGDEFLPGIYRGITLYELHLRYYVESTRYTGFPHAYHTVGSSFAVRADAYCRQGGMNKRKAGEDFYFLQKHFELGTINELNTTRVIPSPRPSSRVPFGTGMAITELEKQDRQELFTYNPSGFEFLKAFFAQLPKLHETLHKQEIIENELQLPDIVWSYLHQSSFHDAIREINENSASYTMFEKRFFRWFNLFRILKFLNYVKEDYPDMEIGKAALELLRKTGDTISMNAGNTDLLWYYRKKQRGF